MSEKTLQSRVRERAKRRGWKVNHVGRGIAAFDATGNPIFVTAADPGFPDLMLAKEGHALIWIELKREDGVVSNEQVVWLQLLNRCGCRGIVVRPSDLRLGRVNTILSQGSPIGLV